MIAPIATLVPPHGGVLEERLIPAALVDRRRQEARGFPRLTLRPHELCDLELLATGAASPLRGFMGRDDYESVLDRLRLADGTVWPLPVVLAVSEDEGRQLVPGLPAALVDTVGRLWGVIEVSEIFHRDPRREAQTVYATEDTRHPGVAELLSRPSRLVAGLVHVFPLPAARPLAEFRLSPSATRAEFQHRGWNTVAAFQTRNPMHRAHEHLAKLALEFTDGLLVHPLVGETKDDDVPAGVRFATYQALIQRYFPPERTLLGAFPAAMRYAGPREALFHALVRQNYGVTHLIVGRDHAGVGDFYPPLAAQEIFDRFEPGELLVQPLKFASAFHCRACLGTTTVTTCPHPPAERVSLSGTVVRERLQNGGRIPVSIMRPEVTRILRRHYHRKQEETRDGGPAPLIWLTGLSGAGKSTLALWLQERLGRAEVLDGDAVRAALSPELGFSREDRATNIRRIGFIARLLARNGVPVICAAISPYAEGRDEVRREADALGIPFVEVFVRAPLEVLAARDVKGLYRKARAGEIKQFTGVSDPYEEPTRPEVVVETDRESVEESGGKILSHVEGRRLVPEGV